MEFDRGMRRLPALLLLIDCELGIDQCWISLTRCSMLAGRRNRGFTTC